MTKRDMILDAALTLFSEKGFDGVGVDEIAQAVGMKGPALYHYFKGKDAILDGLLGQTEEYYSAQFGSLERIEHFPDTLREFTDLSLKRLSFTVHDPQIKKVRKMLAMEQFRNPQLRKLTTMHHLTGVENLNKVYLKKLAEKGQLKDYDLDILAFEFTAPVSMLIHLIDREPEQEAEAMERIRQHMDLFVRVYGTQEV